MRIGAAAGVDVNADVADYDDTWCVAGADTGVDVGVDAGVDVNIDIDADTCW